MSNYEILVDIWKTVVGVQQHFNDIEMKIRNFAIVVLGALMGAAGYAQKDNMSVVFIGERVPLATFILFTALVSWGAFYFMDRHWYHRLLYGAVKHGQRVENRLRPIIPEIDLTKTIGDESPIPFFRWRIHSTHKISIFYGLVAIVIVGVAVCLFFGATPTLVHKPIGAV